MVRALLVQLPVPNNSITNVPLAAGYLKAYAHAQGLLERVEIDILPRAIADTAGDALLVEAIVERQPNLLGISLYTWNSERSLDLAQRVKARLPGLLVVVGGPEVQRDNDWLLAHPGADVFVLGEGEQTFAELLALIADHNGTPPAHLLAALPGVAVRDALGTLHYGPERVPLSDLVVLPSPYVLGYLDVAPGGMLMVEVSRWCPYSCSFCLYGRNMGTKLGNRYFGLERVLAEIAWGKQRGVSSIHFIEANLNLVPLFGPLMNALADLNSDGQLALYAELRGEHLREEAVAALARAGLKVAEVGLQTANPTALKAALRRTDLAKWAAGTRRLYDHDVEVLLDVIIGLPEDDADGISQTLAFIEAEQLGDYDAFTLQVLPGTAVRREAERYELVFQQRPPYYVLGTHKLGYRQLRQLRREVKHGAGINPDAIEGCPQPRYNLDTRDDSAAGVSLVRLGASRLPAPNELAAHVDVAFDWNDAATAHVLLSEWLRANPSSVFDVYLFANTPATPQQLAAWRETLPYQPGYLDRVAVYNRVQPEPQHQRVSPRLWLVAPWTAQIDPADYRGVAEIIWQYQLAPGETPPFGAWRSAGGAGIAIAKAVLSKHWRNESPVPIWSF